MAYFIFTKNCDNVLDTLYRIAETQNDLNNLAIVQSSYKIIEDSQENFDGVKYGTKDASFYNGDSITYNTADAYFLNKTTLQKYIEDFKNNIKNFLNNNPNNPSFNTWNNYYTQLSNVDLDSINYPLTISLEQYFKNQGQSSYSPLQLS